MLKRTICVDVLSIHEHVADLRQVLDRLFDELDSVMVHDLDSSAKC